MVPLGVYRWTHTLGHGGGGGLPCLVQSVNFWTALHDRGLWDL